MQRDTVRLTRFWAFPMALIAVWFLAAKQDAGLRRQLSTTSTTKQLEDTPLPPEGGDPPGA